MAKQTVVVSLLADTKPFQKAFGSVGKTIGGFAVGALASLAAVGAGITALAIKGGISRALNIEDAQAKLKALGYDSKQVSGVMDDALAAVKGTAFGLDSAVTQAATAMAAGVKQGAELEAYLTMVADGATIAGISMDEFGAITNKVMANGRLSTQEMNQMMDRGIPILAWLADSYGVTAEEMRKMVTAGEVDAARFQEVMEENIGGAAQKSADTTRGAFANMRAAMSRWGAAIVGGALPIAKDLFIFLTDGFDALTGITQPFADELWALVSDTLEPVFQNLKTAFGLINELGFSGFIEQFAPVVQTLMDLSPLGQVIQNIAPHLRDFWDALAPLRDVLADMGKTIFPVIQDVLSNFGGSVGDLAAGLLPILAEVLINVADALAEILPVLETLAGDAFAALFDVISAAMPTVLELAKVFGDVLADVLPIVADLIVLVADTVSQLLPVLMPVVETVLDLVAAFAPLVSVLLTALLPLLTPLIELLALLLPPIIDLIELALTPFLFMLEKAAEAIEMLIGWIETAIGWFVDFVTQGGDAVTNMEEKWAALTGFFEELWGTVSGIFETAWAIVTDVVGTAWEVISTLFTTAGETIKQLVAGAVMFIVKIFQGDFSGAADVVRKVWDNIKGLFGSAGDKIRGLVSGLVGRIKNFFSNMMNGAKNTVSNGISNIVTFFRNLPGKILGFITSLPGKFRSIGRDIISGLIGGLEGAFGWLRDTVMGMGASVANWVKDTLGIKSPSRVFREIGKFTVQGLEAGLSAPNHLGRIMTGLAHGIESAFDPTLSLDTSGGGRFHTGRGGDVNIHVTAGVGDPVEIGRQVAGVLRDYKRSGGVVYV